MTGNDNRALLVIAHGSRRQQANEEFKAQVDVIAKQVQHENVMAAFLELAKPSIIDGIDTLIAQGASEVDVFPLFLNAGKHVQADIPEDLATAQAKHPDVKLNLLDYLGRSNELPTLVASLINKGC